MSDTPNTETTDLSTIDTIARFEALLDDDGNMAGPEDIQDSTEDDSASVDAAPEEAPHSEEDREEDDSDASSTIAAPRSWSAEQQEVFKQLPREAQAIVADRENDRDTSLRRHLNQVAEKEKAITADLARAQAVEQQYAQNLQQLYSLMLPEREQLAQVNWDQLAAYDKDEWVRLKQVQAASDNKVQLLVHEYKRVQQNTQAAQVQQLETHTANELAKAYEAIPEFNLVDDGAGNVKFKDETKAKKVAGNIVDVLKQHNFADNDIPAVWRDHRIVKLLARYSQLEAAEQARTRAQGKRQVPNNPRLMSPSPAPSGSERSRQAVKSQMAQLRKSGSTEDATRLFEMML